MKNLCANILGSATDAKTPCERTFLKVQRSIASFRGIDLVTWTFPHPGEHCYGARRSRLLEKRNCAEDDQHGRMPHSVRASRRVAHPHFGLANAP